jgi:hypothetical protein
MLRDPQPHVCHLVYEQLVREPAAELARTFAFLDLPDDPGAVHYGERFGATGGHTTAGSGDPIGVAAHSKPVDSSLDKWVDELIADPDKEALGRAIVARLDPADVRLWGFESDTLLAPLEEARATGKVAAYKKPKLSGFVFQRKLMLALKKDIDHRPHGKLIRRVRYYCNVLLRDDL